MKIRFALLLLFLVPLSVHAEKIPKPLAPEEAKKAFLKLLDRPKVSMDVKVSETKEADGLVTEKLTFASEKKSDGTIERVPTLIVRPAKQGKYPAVIALHGTGGNKEGLRSWMVELAKHGIMGVAIDARYHGERSDGAKGATAYVAAITKAWKVSKGEPQEHPFYYDTCWDLWRTLDYLESRSDVDATKLGMFGISMGGIETWLAASVDDRVKVAAPLIGVQSFRWSLENDKWQGRANTIKGSHDTAAKDLNEPKVNQRVCRELWSKVIPGILDDFDCPNLIQLFAGRALLIGNGETDGNCPIEGARIAFKAAEDAFAKANAKDKLKILVENVGHKVTDDQRKATLEWFEKWLTK